MRGLQGLPGLAREGGLLPLTPTHPPRRILKCSPPFPSRIGPVAQDLLRRLMCKDPKKRLGAGPQGAQDVKNHPFFQVRLLLLLWVGGQIKDGQSPARSLCGEAPAIKEARLKAKATLCQ